MKDRNCRYSTIIEAGVVLVAAFGLLVGGCAGTTPDSSKASADDDPSDPKEASFLGSGKADNGVIAPGSSEAEGVLELVNEASFVELDDEASLDRRAAQHIVEHRNGPDRTPGTSDDSPIESLEELDGIYWVGPATVTQLLEYAERNGYVEDSDAAVHGIEVGSHEAAGVLEVANELSEHELDEEVSLDVRAAENIVDYRHGRDGEHGTDDDRTFETLDELDGVSWVSSRAFDKLLTYAENNRYVPVDHWRDLFETGRVDVTFVKTDQSCEVYSCGGGNCREYETESWHDSHPNFRVTGQKPGELTIEYEGDHDSTNEETTFESSIGSEGNFRVGYGEGYDNPNASFEQYFTGTFKNDYEHEVTYHRSYEQLDDTEEVTCTSTYQRASRVD